MDFRRRIDALQARMEQAGVDLVCLTRGANLFYLTGIRRPLEHGTDHNAYGDWASIALVGRRDGVVVLAPRMGGSFYSEEAQGKPWVREVRLILESEDPAAVLRSAVQAVAGSPRRVALDERLWARTALELRQFLPEATFSLASDLMAPLRMIKDEEEIAAMRRAAALADQVFEAVARQLVPGVTELEVALEIERQFALLGAEYTSFETGVFFIGGGEPGREGTTRSSTGRRLRHGDSVMFDFGCVLDGYCSDFGRCAFVGEPPEEYRRVHALVLQAQAEAMSAMRAGQVTAAEVNAIARRVIEEAGYGEGFTHRLGHGIGVTVHEPPYLDVVDQTVLQANMTFTVEPSVVVPGRFGNRVEDVVLVTERGGQSLNRAPHNLVIVG
ncbi:Xaa-Pro peptidase family protein [Thermomicrobiaceae bacterium CFH 74404]|uniref:Xaa-Pro peptidase family protein n=1 Tax=Thermalbibacter longus TaxID=2951981 RepID=A0AA42BA68_9BACT|nr:Xaa-Pro peptidase family protein [Thermalbibacter longus]MCM8748155.1 Xaa-Pro peptidase family protein [Thermalbibacter longus]